MCSKNTNAPSPTELAELTERVLKMLPELNKYDEFPNVSYDNPRAREIYKNAADGIFPEISFDIENKPLDCADIEKIYENAHSALAKAAALNVYKKSRAAIHDGRYDVELREELFAVLEKIKLKSRNYGEPHNVVENEDDTKRWIYSYENGPMVREVKIKSKKQGMKPLEIVQFSDTHFNYCNERDLAEANPALMSTLEHRRWHANGDTADVAERSLKYASMSDQTVVTGDILDYLSFGAQELTQKHLFWKDSNMLAAIGGHDVTREMQGVVADTTSLESRFDILRSFWCNDIFYASKIIGERVTVTVMDNGSHGRYGEEQFVKLKRDIEYARQNSLIMLIFQHEPLCTRNPDETEVPFVRANDPGCSRNFLNDYIGGEYTECVLKDEQTMNTCSLIRQSGDVIKGLFCGHLHSDLYTEIIGTDSDGMPNGMMIPQYILTATVYENLGHVMKITVD